MPTRGAILSLLLLTSVAAGCLGTDAPGTPGQGDPTTEPGTLDTLYLTGRMGLIDQAPTDEAPERVATKDFYATWTQGEEQPTWTSPAATRSAWHITQATLTFHYTAEDLVATTGPQDQGFPEFVVYFGTEQAPMAYASPQGPDVLQEGEVVEIRAQLELPRGGLVLPVGVQPIVKIAPVQAQQEEAARLVVLVNGTSAPSRVDLQAQPLQLPATTQTPVLDETGMLVGQAYVLGQTEGVSSQTFELEVPPGTQGLIASMERLQGAGIADIDLEARGPEGEVVARSVTPEDDEGLALYAPNIEAVGPGTWQLRVTNYGNVVAEFSLTASLLERA